MLCIFIQIKTTYFFVCSGAIVDRFILPSPPIIISTDVQSVQFICIAFECSDYKNLARVFCVLLKVVDILLKGLLSSLSQGTGASISGSDCCFMVVFQYGSIVLFNVSEPEVDGYLKIVERHASGLLPEMRKDGKFIHPQF